MEKVDLADDLLECVFGYFDNYQKAFDGFKFDNFGAEISEVEKSLSVQSDIETANIAHI